MSEFVSLSRRMNCVLIFKQRREYMKKFQERYFDKKKLDYILLMHSTRGLLSFNIAMPSFLDEKCRKNINVNPEKGFLTVKINSKKLSKILTRFLLPFCFKSLRVKF